VRGVREAGQRHVVDHARQPVRQRWLSQVLLSYGSGVGTSARSYRGLDAQQRAADRRRRLLDAALELFGTRGHAGTKIQDVCAAAGVTARHFYEAFNGREELLGALYEEVVATHLAEVAAALDGATDPLRAGLGAALDAWARDERRARIAFVEVVGVSAALEERRAATVEAYAAFVAGELARVSPHPRDFSWGGRALVGATIQVFLSWLALPAGERPPLTTLTEELATLFAAPVALP
jgi:AcrR family transcriptional regulator